MSTNKSVLLPESIRLVNLALYLRLKKVRNQKHLWIILEYIFNHICTKTRDNTYLRLSTVFCGQTKFQKLELEMSDAVTCQGSAL